MKALFLTTILPHRKQIGSEVASQSLIEGLRADGVEVDVVGYVRPDDRIAPAAGEIAVQARYIESSRAKLYPLPDDTVVYPGHGPVTTTGHEKRSNPFVGEG